MFRRYKATPKKKQKGKKARILLSASYLIWTRNKQYKRKSDILMRKGNIMLSPTGNCIR